MMFPFLTVFIIFLLVTYARREMISKRQRDREEAFWAREAEAEHTPAKNLSEIEYIPVPLSELPIGQMDDDDIMMIEEELLLLADHPLLNLNGMTNADVKLTYGTANFDAVSQMGEDFDRWIVLLSDYAKALMEAGYEREAVSVLEYGRDIGSDLSANFTLLGECYQNLGEEEKLEQLKEWVAASELPRKQHILEEISAEKKDDLGGSDG